ncbi:amino acid adenylation domain-containing protein [Flavobacterium sp. ZT3R18]|uniref:non-ribosomal peptide synthetase n=1 Tax=Flavobacterium sp. ZT3R18 TaxID=2594429 RepID=UPI001179F7C7|nr:non-ribosomal peptide synthetase [Flavobacterium sp. ZT3R18]TRX31189.1 amino acid adenylation domain-containing protein [Flavobacterium sp. ZT3R18]
MIENLIYILQSLNIRLKIDNGDLKINAPKGALTPEIIEDIKAYKNELITLLSSSEFIPKAGVKDYYALTSSQHQLWTLSQFEGGSSAYNIFEAFEFKGVLDFEKLTQAFKILIERHESLRTVFKEDEQENLGQYIVPVTQYSGVLQLVDLNNATAEVLSNQADTLQRHAFDLEKGPLFIGEIVKAAADHHILMLNMHHIIGDGWSMGVLCREFMAIYNGLSTENEVVLPELPIQYKDYSEWQNNDARQSALEKAKTFWLNTFSGEIPVLELPSNKARPKLKSYNGAGIEYTFSKTTTSQLNTYAQQNGVSLFMVLMAGINGLLSRYTNTRDIILGTPIAGRAHSDLENQVGLYLNTLAIRTAFEQEVTFEDLLAVQKETLLNAYSHQEYPFDNLVEELGIKRDLRRSVLFDVLVVFQNQEELLTSQGLTLNNVEVSPYKQLKKSFSKFDLSFIFREKQGELSLYIEYNTDIYELDFVERFVSHFDKFLAEAIQNPNQKVAKINYLGSHEESQLLYDFNDTTVAYPEDTTMVDLFVNQAAKTPQQIALVTDGKSYTYKELDEVSNQLSHYLLSNYNLAVEDLVGVKLDRSEWLLISLLAVLKSGCAYVPIDPNYPAQRIAYIEQDSKCKITIDEKFISAFRESAPISISLPQVSFNSDNLAYIIYTSGSTGKPKGVMITHKNASSMLHWSQREFSDSDFDILYAVTSHCFDLSVYEFFYPLSIGKQIRLLQNGLSIGDYLDTDKNVLINTVPSVIHTLIDKGISFKNAVGINLAGEAFPVSIANHFKDSGIAIRNLYGPSEDTTYSSYYRVEGSYESSVPIGKAIDNSQFYILSDALALQPVGVIGEICISGDGLSRGYLYQPELTAEKFIANPFRESGNLYKTGDLGKWLPDGTIACIGRKDSQVKIRGHRVELGEIEHVLESQQGIDQCVVVAGIVQGEQVIISYLVSAVAVDKQQLRLSLARELPEYMLPSYYVFMDQLPLTPNGKIDKNALPPVSTKDIIQAEYIAPTNEIEEQLVAIWEEILGLERIGITDNFFELGGNSLKVARLIEEYRRAFKVKLSLEAVFSNPILENHVQLIKESTYSEYQAIPVIETNTSYALSAGQKRLWALSQLEGGASTYNMSFHTILEGNYDIAILKKAIYATVERHEILRTVFKIENSGELRQHIIPNNSFNLDIPFVNIQDEIDKEYKITTYAKEDKLHSFDLAQGPLVRACIFQLEDEKYAFHYSMHHIISDGWSMEVLSKDVFAFYDAFKNNTTVALPPLKIQYKDYVSWQQLQLEDASSQLDKVFWKEMLNGTLPILDLPSQKKRPTFKTSEGRRFRTYFSEEQTTAIKGIPQEHGGSLFIALLSTWNILFHKYTGERDIIIGAPVAGRNHIDLLDQIGFYVNTIALRNEVSPELSFVSFYKKIKEQTLKAYNHQMYPFDQLIDDLNIQHQTSRNAIFDVILSLQTEISDRTTVQKEISTTIEDTGEAIAKFDLDLNFHEEGQYLLFDITYNTNVYDADMIQGLMYHYKQLWNAILEQPNQMIADLKYLSETEESQLIHSFNDNTIPYLEEAGIVALFQQQVEKTPDTLAVVYGETQITYAQLDLLSNAMSQYIRNTNDINPEDLICVKLEKSDWYVITLLAILKSGAAYVPIDRNYPEDRIAFIQSDSNCVITIDDAFIAKFKNEAILLDYKEVAIQSSNLAYVIYTSGSTGKPKGVMVEHKSLSNLCHWHQKAYNLTKDSRCTLYASIGFDASTWELFPTLLSGGCVYPIPEEIRLKTDDLVTFFNTHKITQAFLPTVLYKDMIQESAQLKQPLKLLVGGEALIVTEVQEQLEIYNNYGPTENAVVSTYYKVNQETTGLVPIGKPIGNVKIYILDKNGNLVPPGVTGELCLAGKSLARGYLNSPSLTQEKFISHPLVTEGKLYKTGDLAKWLPDGNIQFMGREDSQIKLRGYRIELGEIEVALREIEEIKEAIVLIKEIQNEKYITAYVVCETSIDRTVLKKKLSRTLADYMLPAYFIYLDVMPLTTNGKIDMKALPNIDNEQFSEAAMYVAPGNDLEKKLVKIWQEVLQKEKIGIEDNFFALGGHSLKAIQVISKIQKEFNIKFELRELYNEPTITYLAHYIESIQILNNQQIIASVMGKELIF